MAAEAGITGVNFAVAETGGIVVCTNEGNADIGISLPQAAHCLPGDRETAAALDGSGRLHATAGAQRNRPTDHDLHVALSRTGAGRRTTLRARGQWPHHLRADEHFREALCCIRCGACLNTCPVYRRSGGYSYHATIPGPIGSVLNAAIDPRTFHSLPYACSLCGSCADVCPVKIPLDQQLLHLRGKSRPRGIYLGRNAC